MVRRILLGFLATIGILLASGIGCTTHDPADSSIPWGRPASWEDRIPGMSDY